MKKIKMLTTKTSNDLSNAHLKIIGVFSHTAVWRYSGGGWWRQTVCIAAAKCHGWEWLRSNSSVYVRVLQPGLFKIQSVADSLSRMRRVHFQFCRLYFLTTYCQGRGSYTTSWDLRQRALIPITKTWVPRCPHSLRSGSITLVITS